MHLKNKLFAVAGVLLAMAGLLYGSTLTMREGTEKTAAFSMFDRKDTIYFWYDDDSYSNYINSAAVTFGERENVYVIPVLVSASEYLEAINRASLEEKQLPDAYLIGHDSLEKAYLAGLATEINDVAGICNEESFPKAALSAVTYRGKKVAYPLSFNTSVLVYNETYLAQWAAQIARRELLGEGNEPQPQDETDTDAALLEQKTQEYFSTAVPETIDDILNIADSFDVPAGVEGVMEWDVTDIFYNYWLVGNYLTVGGENGDDKTNLSIDNQEAIRCLEKYKELNQFFFIEADRVDYEEVVQRLLEGRIVFTIATVDVLARLEEAMQGEEYPFAFGVATMPRVTQELDSRSMSVTDTIVVNGYSENKDVANRFAAYLVKESADSLYEKTAHAPAALHTDSQNGLLQVFKEEYAESVPLPKMMNTANFWMLLERVFTKVWKDEDATALLQELNLIISSQI